MINVFKKNGRVMESFWKRREETLETVKERKYLGVWLRSSEAMIEHILQIK